MEARRHYRKSKKTTVQLTSLLDLLFVMIFVSLIQQKNIPTKAKQKKKEPVTVVKTVVIKPKVEKPTPPPKPSKYNVSAIFSFYSTPTNPGVPAGSFEMQGTYDEKTKNLNLFGAAWIKRPAGFDMVPMSGKLNSSGDSITGKIDSPWCKTFNIKRAQLSDKNEISGVWKGSYDCGQGATGLSLTIK